MLIVPNMETALACGSEMRCEILLLWQWVRMCANCFLTVVVEELNLVYKWAMNMINV